MSNSLLTNFIVVESQPLLRDSLIALIKKQSFSGNIHSVASVDSLEDIVYSKSIHCIILDPIIDTGLALNVLTQIVAIRPNIYILAYSSKASLLHMTAWSEVNMMGVVSRLEPIETFEFALMAAANGYAFEKPEKIKSLNRSRLSHREAVVLTLLTEGHRNKEVARRLNISEKTVSTYKRRILDKFGIDNIMALLSKPKVNNELLTGFVAQFE